MSPITLNASSGSNAFNDTGSLTLFGSISGAGGLVETGTATLVLQSANNYAGDTNIAAGTLWLSAANAIPYGPGTGNVIDNGTLTLAGWNTSINGLSGSGTVNGGATLTVGNNNATSTFAGTLSNVTLTKTGSGTLTLTGTSSTDTAGTNINGGTISISSSANLGATSGVTLNGSGAALQATQSFTLPIPVNLTTSSPGADDIDVTSGNTLTVSGAVTGAGALTKSGSGTLILTSTSNAYNGGTNVNAGTFVMGSDYALGTLQNAGSVSVAPGASLDLNGYVGNNRNFFCTLTIGGSGVNNNGGAPEFRRWRRRVVRKRQRAIPEPSTSPLTRSSAWPWTSARLTAAMARAT